MLTYHLSSMSMAMSLPHHTNTKDHHLFPLPSSFPFPIPTSVFSHPQIRSPSCLCFPSCRFFSYLPKTRKHTHSVPSRVRVAQTLAFFPSRVQASAALIVHHHNKLGNEELAEGTQLPHLSFNILFAFSSLCELVNELSETAPSHRLNCPQPSNFLLALIS